MAEKVFIYHNPRCSKSRQALAILEEQQVEHEVILYLNSPLTTLELNSLLKKLRKKPRDLLRKTESEFKSLGLQQPELSDKELLKAMSSHPKLMERPIVVKGNSAIVARPPELVLEFLGLG